MKTVNQPTRKETEQSTGTEPLWKVDDVATFLRLSSETVRNIARRGELPSI